MTAVTFAPNVSAEDVNAFCDFSIFLRSIWWHYQILFEETDLRRDLLQSNAPRFFSDIRRILIEYLILQVCKITDPEESKGRKNLTVEFLITNSDLSTAPGELAEVKRINDSMQVFRAKIVNARNKLIGHLDRHSVLDGKALGAADESQWNQFWLDLQDFLYILHKRYIDPKGHFYLNAVGSLSDADALVKALRENTYFHALLEGRQLTREA